MLSTCFLSGRGDLTWLRVGGYLPARAEMDLQQDKNNAPDVW